MSRSKTCEHCAYFLADAAGRGMCRRYPPVPMIMQQPATVLGGGGVGMAGVSPPVDPTYSCGEFRDATPLAAVISDQAG